MCITQYIVFSNPEDIAASNDDNKNHISSLDLQNKDSELDCKEPFNKFARFYSDPANQRSKIREENNGKIGVYAWVNKINNKVYVGSGDPLYTRLSDYYQPWYLASRGNLYVVRAFNKYTMARPPAKFQSKTPETNFSLYIRIYKLWISYSVRAELNKSY